jgi:hypothetical protein
MRYDNGGLGLDTKRLRVRVTRAVDALRGKY